MAGTFLFLKAPLAPGTASQTRLMASLKRVGAEIVLFYQLSQDCSQRLHPTMSPEKQLPVYVSIGKGLVSGVIRAPDKHSEADTNGSP